MTIINIMAARRKRDRRSKRNWTSDRGRKVRKAVMELLGDADFVSCSVRIDDQVYLVEVKPLLTKEPRREP